MFVLFGLDFGDDGAHDLARVVGQRLAEAGEQGPVVVALVLGDDHRLQERRLEGHHNHAWGTFAAFAAAAALTQLFVVWTPRNQSYHTSMVFLLPAALILPPELFVLVPLVQHIPEWLKERYAWYVQTFNIANYTLASLAAYVASRT